MLGWYILEVTFLRNVYVILYAICYYQGQSDNLANKAAIERWHENQ
jgi:hypothetical protein